jgi:dehydrogenase/reductase SDR family protein 7B
MDFQNKVVWITGASSGIGEAVAYQLAKQKAILVLSSRKKESLEVVQQNCLKYTKEVYVQVLDLEKHEEIPAIAKKVLAERGKIDLLINNGGISQRSLTKDTVFEVDKRLMNINYLGTIGLTKAVLPSFIEQQSGQIATVTSLTGIFGTPYRSAYAATKHALHGFFDSLRAELINDNITITLICPGFIKTQVAINAFVGDGSAQNQSDDTQSTAMDVDLFAKKMIAAIAKKKKEVYIGKKETIMAYVKRFTPWLYYIMIPKVKVK